MRTWLYIFLVLMCLALPAHAGDWSTQDAVLEAVYLGLSAIDWHQSLAISTDDKEGWYERNTILGKHPSRGQVNLYFAACTLLHPLVTWLFPPSLRPYWQGASVGFEGRGVAVNYTIGIR
jgi:hypothetical protein